MEDDDHTLPIWLSAADNAAALATCAGHLFDAPVTHTLWACLRCRGVVSDAERRPVDRRRPAGHSAAVDTLCSTCRNLQPPRTCLAASRGASGAPALASGQTVRTCTAFEGQDGRQTLQEVPPRVGNRPLREG